MDWTLAFLLPYLVGGLVLIVLWSLACVMYAAVRNEWPPVGTWVIGLLVIVGAPALLAAVLTVAQKVSTGGR